MKWTCIEVRKKISGMFKRSLVIRILMDISGIKLNGQVIMRLLGS